MGLEENCTASGRPLSVRAFAEAAETSPRRIRRLIRQGRLQTIENQAGEVRIPEGELDRLQTWQESRLHHNSMELSAVSVEWEPRPAGNEEALKEAYAMQIPLQRHEAAMMRLGYLESELANTRLRLEETVQREAQFKLRAETSEQELSRLKIASYECEQKLEDMRTQVIDSTFRAVELQNQLKTTQQTLNTPWWQRAVDSLRKKADK